jgi:hypothetical protein
MTGYEESGSASAPEPALTALTALCGAGTCPAIYRTDRGTLVVQGRTIASETVGIDLPEGELLVEIPEELLAEAVAANLRNAPSD